MICGFSGCIDACLSFTQADLSHEEMCRHMRCNSEDGCALCRIEVYIQAEDRTENDCGEVLTLLFGRYLFSRSASACVTVDVETCPLTANNDGLVTFGPFRFCSNHGRSDFHFVAQNVTGTSCSCRAAENCVIQRRMITQSDNLFSFVEALELALNPIPCPLNFHRFPDRHAEVDDWSDDCDTVKLCFDTSFRDDAGRNFFPEPVLPEVSSHDLPL